MDQPLMRYRRLVCTPDHRSPPRGAAAVTRGFDSRSGAAAIAGLALWLGGGGGLAAQTDSASRAPQRAPAVIVPADLARDLAALGADTGGRPDTSTLHPAPGARYAAGQFEKLALQPGPPAEGVTESPWLPSYPLPGQHLLNYDSAVVTIGTFVRRGGAEVLAENEFEVRKDVTLPLATEAPLVVGAVREGLNGRYLGPSPFGGGPRRPTPVIVAGPQTLATAAVVAVAGKVVFYVPPAERDTASDTVAERRIVEALAQGSAGVVVVIGDNAVRSAARQRDVGRPVPVIDDYLAAATPAPAWTVYARADSLAYVFALAGLDLAELRRARTPIVREPLPLSAWFWTPPTAGAAPRALGANAVGILEGSDSVLKRQYVVLAAHVDRAAPRVATGGADASGAAALLAIARAFSAPGARPRRSLLFVLSDAEHGFAGAEYVAAKLEQMRAHPVAALGLEGLGGAGDSVVIDGLEDLDFGVSAARVAEAHEDVRLTPVGGSIASAPCAEHCAFVHRVVPSLYLHAPGGAHDTASGSIRPGAADLDRTAGAARLAFYLAQAIANANRSPRWRAGVPAQLGARAGD